jgi:hypothetical protein
MTEPISLAVNHALSELQMARARIGLMSPGMGLDSKRNAAWCEYGFKENLEFSDFYNLYRRGGIAHGAINKIIGACWNTSPWVIEGDDQDNASEETKWERSLTPIIDGGRFWKTIAEADLRRLVGRYSGILIQLRDSGRWDQPVTQKDAVIVKLIPVWASSLKPVKFDTNEQSETFGEPMLWQYTEHGVNGQSARQIDVHPDRLFILGDWLADAIGFLEPAYNAFVSMEKVEGGSGESFLKNAARQLGLNFSESVDLNNIASMYGVSIGELQHKFNDAARDLNRANDLLLITQGATTTPLVSSIPDPTPTYNVNLQTAAAAMDIPTKILVGMQTGERASSEDQKYFNARCQARRGELAFELHDLFRHLMRIRVVSSVAEYSVMWDDLTEAVQVDKLGSAKLMSEINSASLALGETVFTAEEIREVAGYDPLENPEPLEDIEQEDDDGALANSAGE